MRVSSLALGLLGFVSADNFLQNARQNANCLIYHDYTFWDLRQLQSETDYIGNANEGASQIHNYHFNFCRFPTQCDSDGDDTAWVTDFLGDKLGAPVGCRDVTGGSVDDVHPVILKDKDSGESSIKLSYINGPTCPYANEAMTFNVQVKCDYEVEGYKFEQKFLPDNWCHPEVVLTSKHGCPSFEGTSFVKFLSRHPWVIAVLMLFFGIFSCFYGYKFFYIIIGCLSGGAAFLFSAVLLSLTGALEGLEDAETGKLVMATVFMMVCIIIGVVVGWLFAKLVDKIGGIFIGVCLGFLLGVSIYNLFFIQTGSIILLLTLTAAGVLVGGFVGYKYIEKVIIIGSSIIGAYLFVRGISLFVGHFPNEFVIMQEAANGIEPEWEWQFIVYLVSIGILALIGMKVQFTKAAADNESDSYQKMD